MAGIFSKIVNCDIPSWKIAEDDKYFAFLDINPLAKGHTLVIPKKEVDYIFDLDDDVFLGLHAFSKRVARAIKSVISCKRIAVVVLGLEVPHAHIHLIPVETEGQVNFSNPRVKLSQEEFKKIAGDIARAFSEIE